jgi:hypothetical protein
VTGVFVGTPIVRLSAVPDARESPSVDHQVPHSLSRLDPFGPTLDHADTAILNESSPSLTSTTVPRALLRFHRWDEPSACHCNRRLRLLASLAALARRTYSARTQNRDWSTLRRLSGLTMAREGQPEHGHLLAVPHQKHVATQHRVVLGFTVEHREPRELAELIGNT